MGEREEGGGVRRQERKKAKTVTCISVNGRRESVRGGRQESGKEGPEWEQESGTNGQGEKEGRKVGRREEGELRRDTGRRDKGT